MKIVENNLERIAANNLGLYIGSPAELKGKYLESKVYFNYNKFHDEHLIDLNINKRTKNTIKKKVEKDILILSIFSKLPDQFNDIDFNLPPKSGAFYQDILNIKYDGNVDGTKDYLSSPINFKDVVKATKNFSFPSFSYPEAILWDLIDILSFLATSRLTQGFEEAYVVGPELVEVLGE